MNYKTSILTFCLILAIKIEFAKTNSAPYNQKKYREVLNSAHLQAPDSHIAIQAGRFDGEYNEYFYSPDDENKYLTLTITGTVTRKNMNLAVYKAIVFRVYLRNHLS